MMSKKFFINNVPIGTDYKPLIIAEMSGNHNQSLERAMQIVEAAAESGAHALKLQTFTADTITLDIKEGEFFIDDKDSLWKGKSLYELYKEAYTPWEWHEPIINRANELGMLCFSSPFDETAVDFLEKLNVPLYKIASGDLKSTLLLKYVAKTGKPVLVSTGGGEMDDVQRAYDVITAENPNIAILQCTAAYPCEPAEMNLSVITTFREKFPDKVVGLSDHQSGISMALVAFTLGARIVEKHFTLNINSN